MRRNRAVVLAAVVVAFLAIFGYLVSRNTGGGGSSLAIDITVAGSRMNPDTPRAKQGDRLTMTVTADRKEEVHLHGYDIAFAVPAASGRVTHSFTADRTGSFEIEVEDTGIHLGQLQVSP